MVVLFHDFGQGYCKDFILSEHFPDEMTCLEDLWEELSAFTYPERNSVEGRETIVEIVRFPSKEVRYFTNQFWTSRQRQANSLHEVSYRACFKPQLPRFFIERLTAGGGVVYDPFAGRGTTPVEAVLRGRRAVSNDINPLSAILTLPRFDPPSIHQVGDRLSMLEMDHENSADIDLSMFYHGKTESELVSLQACLNQRREDGTEDRVDRWIRMVATNRLTGHSKGFFSVYTLPPNQAVRPERQKLINKKRGQEPEYRDVKKLILGKTKSLLKGLGNIDRENIATVRDASFVLTEDASKTCAIENDSVDLTVTSPPFLNIVQYSSDNWLRCWFNGLDADRIEKEITMSSSLKDWERYMASVFRELFRITKEGGWVAFEVGEVRNGKVRLEESIVPIGIEAGFDCAGVLINSHKFTKTSNIWGVSNNSKGTNTNRIVLLKKPA